MILKWNTKLLNFRWISTVGLPFEILSLSLCNILTPEKCSGIFTKGRFHETQIIILNCVELHMENVNAVTVIISYQFLFVVILKNKNTS